MESLYEKLSLNGRIFFLLEPIMPYFDRPWGFVRYDGETWYQIRKNGWLEIGFREDFFEQLLLRTGFKIRKIHILYKNSTVYEVVKIND